jgi:hypothetical protein
MRGRGGLAVAATGCAALALAGAAGVHAIAQSAPVYKGLTVSASAATRATNVSLADCPAGANIVRGVIRPGDANEFVSVTVDFTVTPGFTPGPLARPVLHAADGKTYNTAQTFGEIPATGTFSCTFSFRVPKGTAVQKLALDGTTVDLAAIAK